MLLQKGNCNATAAGCWQLFLTRKKLWSIKSMPNEYSAAYYFMLCSMRVACLQIPSAVILYFASKSSRSGKCLFFCRSVHVLVIGFSHKKPVKEKKTCMCGIFYWVILLFCCIFTIGPMVAQFVTSLDFPSACI